MYNLIIVIKAIDTIAFTETWVIDQREKGTELVKNKKKLKFIKNYSPNLVAWSLVVVLVARKDGFIEKSGAFSVFTIDEKEIN